MTDVTEMVALARVCPEVDTLASLVLVVSVSNQAMVDSSVLSWA